MGEFYLQYEHLLASAQLILAMLGMGATLRIADFVEVMRFPRGVLAGLCTQLLAIPALALAVASAFGLTPGLAVGLLLIAAVPGGTMSNVLTYFAKGHVPLSISLTGLTTVASLVTTPLLLRLFAGAHLPADVEMPTGRIAFEIAVCLLGPLSLGMIARVHASESAADRIATVCIRASIMVILIIVVGANSADRIDPSSQGFVPVLALLAFTLLALGIGAGSCALLRLPTAECVTVGIEASFRNSSLALLVKAAAFPALPGEPNPFADGVFFAILLYAAMAFAVSMLPVVWHRRLAARPSTTNETSL